MIEVVLLGYSGWPVVRNATSQKQGSIALALKSAGFNVYVSNYVSFSALDKVAGNDKGIAWKFWAYRPHTVGFKIPMILVRILGSLIEGFWLIIHRPRLIIAAERNPIYLLSRILISRLTRSKLIITLVEDPLSSFSGQFQTQKLVLYNYVLTKADGLLPISKNLDDYAKKLGVSNTMILGPLYDFDIQEINNDYVVENRLAFCATAGYREQFEFCRAIHNHLKAKNFSQIWVVSGNENDVQYIKELAIDTNIQILSGLTDAELRKIYRSSSVLLLPMFNTVRDHSRFTNKVAEYLASGRPIITSRVGEIEYLIDQGLVLEAEVNNASDYARVICDTLSSNQASNIERARELFDYVRVGTRLRKFIENV